MNINLPLISKKTPHKSLPPGSRPSVLFLLILYTVVLFAGMALNREKEETLHKIQRLSRTFETNRLLSFLEGTDNPLLQADLLIKQNKTVQALEYLNLCTNNPLLTDYAFYKMAGLYLQTASSQGLTLLERVSRSDNEYLKWFAERDAGDHYYTNKIYSLACSAYESAYSSTLLLEKKHSRLSPLLGRHYKSRILAHLAESYFHTDKDRARQYAVLLLRSTPSKRNPYQKQAFNVLVRLTPLGWEENYLLAWHAGIQKYSLEKRKDLLKKASSLAHTERELFLTAKLWYKTLKYSDPVQAMDQIAILFPKEEGKYTDGLLYFKALLLIQSGNPKEGQKYLDLVLSNKKHSREYETAALEQIFSEIPEKNGLSGENAVFKKYRSLIIKNSGLTRELIRRILLNSTNSDVSPEALQIITNLPWKNGSGFHAGKILLAAGKTNKAVEAFQAEILSRTSSYYSMESCRSIELVYADNPSLEKQNKKHAQLLEKEIDLTADSLRDLQKKYLSVLMYDPDFRISSSSVEKALKKNPDLYEKFGETVPVPENISWFFDRFLTFEGTIELYRIKNPSPGLLLSLTRYFMKSGYPYLQIKYAEQLKYALGPVIPDYMIHHSLTTYLYPRWYSREVTRQTSKLNLDTNLTLAMIREESRFRFDAVSSAGASGLMQLMPGTFVSVRPKENPGLIFHPDNNIHAGTAFFRDMLRRFETEIFALASYNAGGGNVGKWLKQRDRWTEPLFVESIPFTETRNYVKKISYSRYCYQELKPFSKDL